jgi:hypothetical protein
VSRDYRPRDRVGQVKCATRGCMTRIEPRTNGIIKTLCNGCASNNLIDENIEAAIADTQKARSR